MNTQRKRFALVVLLLWPLLAPGVWAQAPAPPPAAAGILGLVQAAAGAIKKCKAKICACPLGQMITNAGKPLNMMLGGLLCPPCCPPVNPDDLKKSSTSPQGACAKITQEELEAPARRKAIKCLSMADCHWWPEAEAGLITGLRVDQNECVRMEAALALLNGCCCTKKTIAALTIVVSGSKKDGNPSENSERVKATALAALQRCLACYVDEDEPERLEKPPKKPKTPPAKPSPAAGIEIDAERLAYYDDVAHKPSREVLDQARRTLTQAAALAQRPAEVVTLDNGGVITHLPTGSRNLMQLWASSAAPVQAPRASATPPTPPRLQAATQRPELAPAVSQTASRPQLLFQE